VSFTVFSRVLVTVDGLRGPQRFPVPAVQDASCPARDSL
jgi:hypothetical protein